MKNIIASVLGFVVLSFFGLAASDYLQQSVIAGKRPGEFTVADWAESFAQRGREAAQRAERELRRDKPMRDYLPTAPAGWTEVPWTAEYQSVMKGKPAPAPAEFADIQAEIEKHPVVMLDKMVGKVKGTANARKKAQSRRVFLRGDKVIIVHAKFKDTRQNKGLFSALTMDSADRVSRAPIKAVHRGVAFRDVTPRKAPDGVQRLRAEIGGELEIVIDALATQADINQVVGRINIGGLRKLTGADTPSKSHTEMVAEMRRQKHLERQKELQMQARADKTLERLMSRARRNGENEVCTTIEGQRFCRWVE